MRIIAALLLAIVIRHDRPDERYHLDAAPYLVHIGPRGGHGTLIAPRWVLTAAHVVHSLKPQHEVTVAGETIPVRAIFLHPGWKSPQTNVVDDIALLELERTANAEPIPIYRRRDEAGQVVTFTGSGATGNGRDGVVRGSPRQLRSATNSIEETSNRWLMFRFDGPETATDLEGISGPGDSGGPAFLTIEGRTYVAGVSSWQDNRKQGKEGLYGVLEFYARVSSYAQWIDETIGNLVLEGALWDGRSDEVMERTAVVIHDGRIASVQANAGEDTGLFILPGLVDNHVHVLDRLVRNRDETVAGLRRWLCSGVTTLVDNGSTLEALRQFRSSPPADVPQIFASGPIFTAPGGYPFGAIAAADSGGADFFKAAIERGFLSDLSDDGWPVPDVRSLAEAVTAAHDRGITARAHVTQREELERALNADFDSLAHVPIDPLPDELLRRARKANVVFVSTLHLWTADAERAANARDNLRRYHTLGGTIALGTDAPSFTPGYRLPVEELEFLIESGLSRADVLRAATSNGALALGRDDFGTVAPGQRGDLLVVRGNPLERISDLKNVEKVILGGQIHCITTAGGRAASETAAADGAR